MPAAAALAAAILLALRTRERPRVRWAAAAAACLAVLPWLGLKYLPAAAVVGSVLVAWMLKRHRGLAALVAAEVAFTSLVTFVSFNDAVYSGLTPFAALSRRRHRDRSADGRRLRRPGRSAGRPVARSRVRPAALGAVPRARLPRRLAAVALAP